jgi:asparagine synthase (glutamine-hydrolysing)
MCGIAGIVRFDGRTADGSVLEAMAQAMVHRGPDGSGLWLRGPVGLSHRRLAIIDLEGSPQPMASVSGRTHVVFNGEILNYRQLRARTPYPYRTGGDTEVLVALLERHGPDAVPQLRGQFAVAAHDAASGDLWLHRDRLGILPLYYHQDAAGLRFASELHALLACREVGIRIDPDAVADYLAHRASPAPHTLLAGVRKLPPGHSLQVTGDGVALLHRWYEVPAPAGRSSRLGPVARGAAVDELADVLDQAVTANLVADVPVGSLLSGGVDSSLITALAAARAGPGRLHTFSAGFDAPEVDETIPARTTAAALGTVHHEITVTAEDFMAMWSILSRHRGGPLSEPADVAVHRLGQLARPHVKVVLSGEGSDELFGGYPKYALAGLADLALTVPSHPRAITAGWLRDRGLCEGTRARTLVRALGAGSRAEQHRSWFAPFDEQERRELAGRTGHGEALVVAGRAPGGPLDAMLWSDCHTWLADNLLERGDRMMMAASVELRPPFLDRGVVELAFRLPTSFKVRRGTGKWVVRQVAQRHLPAEVASRAKAGFRVPLGSWFRAGLRDFARDALTGPGSFVDAVLDRDAVRRLLDAHDGGANHDIRIWTLLSLEVWHRTLISDHRTRLRSAPTPETTLA